MTENYTERTKLMPIAEFDALAQRVSNWGRWGPEDQAGTLNFLTEERRKAARDCIQDGTLVSAAHDISGATRVDDPRPPLHVPFWSRIGDMSVAGEALTITPHGSTITHLDALNHLGFRGKMYNGFEVNPYNTADQTINAITTASGGIVGRGVLVDLAAAKGKEYMEPGEIAYMADVERALERQGCEIKPGDIVFFRTGKTARAAKFGPTVSIKGLAGLSVECAEWVHRSEIAAMVCDGAMDPQPSEVDTVRIPWHVLTLVYMGLMITDNANLERVAQACEEKNRWTFMAALAPLRVLKANASPINPLALF